MNEKKESIVGIIIFTVAALMLMGLGWINGYYDGILHAVEDHEVSYNHGFVTVTLDKWEFLHYVGE